MSRIKGTYKACVNNPKAIKKLEAVKKSLRGQGIPFEVTEALQETNWLDKNHREPHLRIKATHHLIVLTFDAESNFKPSKPSKQAPTYIPVGPPPFDYRNTPEDWAFFAETEKLEMVKLEEL